MNPDATVRDRLKSMVMFLSDMQVNRGLRDLAAEGTDATERRLMRSRQVWNMVMQSFNDMVEQFGDERFADFEPTFKANMESLLRGEPSGVLPKALNAVDVVAFPTPMRPYRFVFVLGACEAQLPAVPHETGLLDDSERNVLAEVLDSHGKRVSAWLLRAATMDGKARREPIAFNLVLRHALEKITVTWPKTSEDGVQQPSAYIAAVTGMPTEKRAGEDAQDSSMWSHELDGRLIDVPRVRDRPPLDRVLATLLFAKHEDRNDEQSPLVFDASVSAIEQYYTNPYDYFLQRGLGINAMRPYELDPMLEGSFYHAVLEHAVGRWMKTHPDTQPELHTMQDYIRDYARLHRSDAAAGDRWTVLDDDPRMAVLASSNRMYAVHRQLVDTLLNMAVYMDDIRSQWAGGELKHGYEITDRKAVVASKRLIPFSVEHQFGTALGKQGDWSALSEYTLHGVTDQGEVTIPLRINGKVDRLEKIIIDDGDDGKPAAGLLVLDYKSSAKQLFKANRAAGGRQNPTVNTDDASTVYSGRELQLFTYARVAKQQTGLPIAGLFFLPIRRKGDGVKANAFNERYKDAMPGKPLEHGLEILRDDAYASSWSMKLGDGGVLTEQWSVSRLRRLCEEGDFEAISDFVQRRIHEACDNIMNGDLAIRPYKTLQDDSRRQARDGTTFSDYSDAIVLDLISGEAFAYDELVTVDQIIGKTPLPGNTQGA